MLSVLVVTYNHSDSIDRALESVHKQVGIRRAEVVVADDASTDDTLAKVARWSDRLRIRILPAAPNMGITRNYQRAFAAVKGSIVAVLEGDDEWSDDLKLRRIKRAMRDRSLTMVGNRSRVVTEGSDEEYVWPYPLDEPRRFSADDIAGGNPFTTFSACAYRTAALRRIDPRVFELKAYDWLVNMLVTEQGAALLLPDVMTVYYRHAGGVWSRMTQAERDQEVIDLIPGYREVVRPATAARLDALEAQLTAGLA
jgi:glycosyltransferase involved in cell wall biosynthesis